MAVCSSCGSEVSGSSKFCTACGKPITAAPTATASASCAACGSNLQPSTRFCTACGAAVAAPADIAAAPPVPIPEATLPEPSQPEPPDSASLSQATAPPAPANQPEPQFSTPPTSAQHTAPDYPVQFPYPPAQQRSGGRFSIIVVILLLVLVVCGLGAWYFWGVETVVVVSPPDARVFLDNQELTANSPGRYVVPHLSRKPHLLKVQSPGFAETVQRLDFPLSSINEWVNITLVRSRR